MSRITDLFENEDKVAAARELRNLLRHRGWKHLLKVWELEKNLVEERMFDGDTPAESVLELRLRRSLLKDIMRSPQSTIEELGEAEGKEDDLDPYA